MVELNVTVTLLLIVKLANSAPRIAYLFCRKQKEMEQLKQAVSTIYHPRYYQSGSNAI